MLEIDFLDSIGNTPDKLELMSQTGIRLNGPFPIKSPQNSSMPILEVLPFRNTPESWENYKLVYNKYWANSTEYPQRALNPRKSYDLLLMSNSLSYSVRFLQTEQTDLYDGFISLNYILPSDMDNVLQGFRSIEIINPANRGQGYGDILGNILMLVAKLSGVNRVKSKVELNPISFKNVQKQMSDPVYMDDKVAHFVKDVANYQFPHHFGELKFFTV